VRHAKTAGQDPRQSFAMADADKVFARMIAASPAATEAQEKQASRLGDMFKVSATKPDFTKVASEVVVDKKLSEMTGPETAAAYLSGEDVSKVAFTIGQVSDAVADLGRVFAEVKTNWAQCENFEEQALSKFAAEVEAQMHSGMTPATIKSAVARSQALDHTKKAATDLVTSIAATLGAADGKDQIGAGSIIDEQHPMLEALEATLAIDATRGALVTVAEKVADAQERAGADLKRALSEGHAKLAFLPSTLLPKAKGLVGAGLRGVGTAFDALEVKNRSAEATNRLKKMQRTPMVGAMKMASIFDGIRNMKPSPQQLLGAVGVAVAAHTAIVGADKAIGAIGSTVGGIFERRKRDKLFEKLVTLNPDLKTNPRAREYFDLVMTYAPVLGDHPTAIGDFLRRQLQYPVASHEFLESLARLQKTVRDGRAKGPSVAVQQAHGVVSQAHGGWLGGE
jgi:hypothetical protein